MSHSKEELEATGLTDPRADRPAEDEAKLNATLQELDKLKGELNRVIVGRTATGEPIYQTFEHKEYAERFFPPAEVVAPSWECARGDHRACHGQGCDCGCHRDARNEAEVEPSLGRLAPLDEVLTETEYALELATTLKQLRAAGWAVEAWHDVFVSGERFSYICITRNGNEVAYGTGPSDLDALQEIEHKLEARFANSDYADTDMRQKYDALIAWLKDAHRSIGGGIGEVVIHMHPNTARELGIDVDALPLEAANDPEPAA